MATKKRSTPARLSPLRDHIMIKRIGTDKTLPAGVIIPDIAKEILQEGEVVVAGSGKAEKSKGASLNVKVGDRVLFSKYSGGAVRMDDQELLILREDEILGNLGAETKPWKPRIGAGKAAGTIKWGDPMVLDTKPGHRMATGKPSDFAAQAKALEEEVEFSNVTNFRNSLLGAVERLQSNPAKRFVITKRGEPEAVLMSYKTYSLLTRVMNQALENSGGQDREESVPAAFDRMRREHPLNAQAPQMSAAALESPAHPAPVTGGAATPAGVVPDFATLKDKIQAIRWQVVALDDTLQQQERAAQTPAAEPVSENE